MEGHDLIADMNACRLTPGQAAMWWLGQSGFAVKLGRTILYVDAFLSEFPDRLVAPLLSPAEVVNADAVLGSHDHPDHIDRPAWPAIAGACPKAVFVVPLLLREAIARELALPDKRVTGVDQGVGVTIGDVTITAIPAAHEFLDTDPATGLSPHIGFLLEGNGLRIYHAGDTCVYEGLHDKLRAFGPDVTILPINGRDARRLQAGCIGNMMYQEAVDLAGGLGIAAMIPAHYDMFAINTASVQECFDYARVKYPRMNVIVPRHGRRIVLGDTSGTER